MKIFQGAEAIISRDGKAVVKERIKKRYRIGQIDDNIRSRRTRSEARLIREARRAGILTPQIIEESNFIIKMEFLGGRKVKDILDANNACEIAGKIGDIVARLHEYNIIHGDLTTSNMIVKNDDIYLIDFGLGFHSARIEDKATDMHLLKEALESTHFDVVGKMWPALLDAYKTVYPEGEKVIKTLSKIEKRGRYSERRLNDNV